MYFAVNQQRHAFLEAHRSHAGLSQLFFQAVAKPSSFKVRSCARVVFIIISESSLVVAGAAHMGMLGTDPVASRCGRALVAVVHQDVAHVAVLAGTDLQCEHAARFKSGLAETLSQRQQTQAGAVAMLGCLFSCISRVTARRWPGRYFVPSGSVAAASIPGGRDARGHVRGGRGKAASRLLRAWLATRCPRCRSSTPRS